MSFKHTDSGKIKHVPRQLIQCKQEMAKFSFKELYELEAESREHLSYARAFFESEYVHFHKFSLNCIKKPLNTNEQLKNKPGIIFSEILRRSWCFLPPAAQL